MKINTKQIILLIASTICFSGIALAHPPQPNVYDDGNKWHITFYNDPTTGHDRWATQEICFLPYAVVGTSIQGVWYATSFPDWNGRYYQEGDELKMTGDYAQDVGHDHMTLQHTTNKNSSNRLRDMAFKDWTEWREDGRYGRIIGWGNTSLVRVGKCPFPTSIPQLNSSSTELEEWAYKESITRPDRLTTSGAVGESPGQEDLESLEAYQQRTVQK